MYMLLIHSIKGGGWIKVKYIPKTCMDEEEVSK